MESKNPDQELERIDLPITGMLCASCAAKIEKGLAGVEGVSKATVNFAAEKATVIFHPAQTDLSHLIKRGLRFGFPGLSGLLDSCYTSLISHFFPLNRYITSVAVTL